MERNGGESYGTHSLVWFFVHYLVNDAIFCGAPQRFLLAWRRPPDAPEEVDLKEWSPRQPFPTTEHSPPESILLSSSSPLMRMNPHSDRYALHPRGWCVEKVPNKTQIFTGKLRGLRKFDVGQGIHARRRRGRRHLNERPTQRPFLHYIRPRSAWLRRPSVNGNNKMRVPG